MESVVLRTPEGFGVRLGWDPSLSEHDRKRILAKEIIAERLGIEERAVKIDREEPTNFGTHTQLYATVDGRELTWEIKVASWRAATVVAVADERQQFGLDIRDPNPDDETIREMRTGSRLFEETDVPRLLAHWTRVQAVREADGRGARVRPITVRLDAPLDKGWVPDRPIFYRLVDLTHGNWIVTLAYDPDPVPVETD